MGKNYLDYVSSKFKLGKNKGIDKILRIIKPKKINRQVLPVISRAAIQWSERNVLVGVLRDKPQLQVCLDKKFYHIPCKYISKRHFPLEYIAIYQSKNLFGGDAGVRYIGKIQNCAKVKRSSIFEIPKKSNEYYYRFSVHNWQLLENPIEAKEVGFVRIFTNYEMLLNSREVPEILLSNRTEHDLYNCIKNATVMAQKDKENKISVFAWDDFGFAVDVDDIQLIKDGQFINMYSVYDFLDMPLTILGQIRRDMDRALS